MKKTKRVFLATLFLCIVFACLFALASCKNDDDDDVNENQGAEENCTHTATEWVVCEEATCINNGKKEQICTSCNVVISTEVISAIGHIEEKVAGYSPTCQIAGLTDGKRCSVCETILENQQPIQALGHTEKLVPGQAATCSKNGLTDGKVCSVCGDVIVHQSSIPTVAHTYDDKYDESCNVCGFVRDAACAHLNVQIVPGSPATCTEAGLTDGSKCTKCGETVTIQEVIPATGHTEQNVPGKAATCTETGLTDGKVCSACHATLISQSVIPVVAHTYDDKYDETCNKCGFVREVECAHTNSEVIPAKSASCTESGLTAGSKCSKCGEILVNQETIPATGHTEQNVPGKAATCTETGLTDGKVCSVCHATLISQTNIPASGHKSGEWMVDTQAHKEDFGGHTQLLVQHCCERLHDMRKRTFGAQVQQTRSDGAVCNLARTLHTPPQRGAVGSSRTHHIGMRCTVARLQRGVPEGGQHKVHNIVQRKGTLHNGFCNRGFAR